METDDNREAQPILDEVGRIMARGFDGIGVEDLFTDGKRARNSAGRNDTISLLETLRPAGKRVLAIDYATKNDLRRLAAAGARERGYILLQSDRNLTTLGVSGMW